MMNLSPARVLEFLTPRSIALVGATDSSTFSALGFANLTKASAHVTTHLVNPHSSLVHGQPTVASCSEVDGGIDLAMIMLRSGLTIDALRDAAAAGARGAVVLGSGFAEAGEEGKRLQRRLVDAAEELDLILLGPNSLGFANLHAGIGAITMGDPFHPPGSVALISQSGASCGAMKDFAALSAIGLSHIVTVGNEASLTIGHLIDAFIDDPNTSSIAVFVEAIREPDVFRAAALRALNKNKAIVILKAGRSELAAAVAQSHTGALVGDDTVIGAVFDHLGIMRVDSIEELLVTAGVAAHTGKWKVPSIGMVSMSGGACDMVADMAESEGVQILQLSQSTVEDLHTFLPEYGSARNPLDITGAAIKDPELWTKSIISVGKDPVVGALLAVHNLPLGDSSEEFYGQKFINAIGAGMGALDIPAMYVTQVTQPLGALARRALRDAGICAVVPGMQLAVRACGRLAKWSATLPPLDLSPQNPTPMEALPTAGTCLSESQVRDVLVAAGITVIPSFHVHSAAEVLEVIEELKSPVAMKIVSPDITHKSDIGGVKLHVTQLNAVDALNEILTSCAPYGQLDGTLISPMRHGGVELLVGVRRDPEWGLLLALGAGGLLVEVLADVSVICLPIDRHRVAQALKRTKLWPMLLGVRGGQAADLDQLTDTIVRICALAEALGPRLESLEINPLRIDGHVIEAMDAVISWS